MAEQLQNPAAPQGLAVLATPGGARAATAAATPGLGRFEFADDVAGIMQVSGKNGWVPIQLVSRAQRPLRIAWLQQASHMPFHRSVPRPLLLRPWTPALQPLAWPSQAA